MVFTFTCTNVSSIDFCVGYHDFRSKGVDRHGYISMWIGNIHYIMVQRMVLDHCLCSIWSTNRSSILISKLYVSRQSVNYLKNKCKIRKIKSKTYFFYPRALLLSSVGRQSPSLACSTHFYDSWHLWPLVDASSSCNRVNLDVPGVAKKDVPALQGTCVSCNHKLAWISWFLLHKLNGSNSSSA